MKRISALMLVAILLVVSALGCNATRGAGKDISDAGKHIQNIGK